MRKIRDVLRLKFEAGVGERQIAEALGVARSTVQEALRRAREGGVTWPLPPDMDEVVLQARLYPHKVAAATIPPCIPSITDRRCPPTRWLLRSPAITNRSRTS